MNREDLANAQRGETFRLSKAYGQAIAIFEDLQTKYPDNAWVNAHLGTTYCQLLNYGAAQKYLDKAIAFNPNYTWAHAQLGETYRLRAIAEDREETYLNLSIEHFKIALDGGTLENSHYAWALAHLGATYRLKMTLNLENLANNQIDEASKAEALKCFKRAIELIPTYAWAWGMQATIHRLAQEYEDSYWDLEVETVIAPEIGVLQNSPSPVPFLETRRVNLHEHALLSFYLTKNNSEQKVKHYIRAIAYARQALILRSGDLIAQLILLVIEGNQKKDEQNGSLKPDNIEQIKAKLKRFFEEGQSKFSEICQQVLRHLIRVGRINVEYLQAVALCATDEHKLTRLILKDVIENPDRSVDDEPELWLWQNYDLTQTCSIVLFLLSDLSCLLNEAEIIGSTQPYRDLSTMINRYYTGERLYQTPVLSDLERKKCLNNLLLCKAR